PAQVVGDPILPMIADCQLRCGGALAGRRRSTAGEPEKGTQAECRRDVTRAKRKRIHAILLPRAWSRQAAHRSLDQGAGALVRLSLRLTATRARTSGPQKKNG